MSDSFESHIAAALADRRGRQLYRTRRVIDSPQGTRLIIGDKEYLSFCSNDYLGLANHPDVLDAFKKGADQYGVGSGAAHLISGHFRVHHQLECELAEFLGYPRALLFSTGFMANSGVVTALINKGDAVFEDRLNHASLIDAGLQSGARFQRYLHCDMDSLKSGIEKSSAHKNLIVSDGVFSMDGHLAPLPELATIARKYHAWLMIDDAHGIGVLGNSGRGMLEHFNLSSESVQVLMGTLGKAFGTFGAFVAGSDALIEYLIHFARSYIYTTALPPAVAAASRRSLEIIRQETWRRDKLKSLIEQFRKGAQQLGLSLLDSQSPIQPVIIGDIQGTLQLSQSLYQQGLLVSAVRPPTVPDGTARLRITFCANHDEKDIERLLDALEKSGT